MLRLSANQSTHMRIQQHAVPVSHYLKQPRRLVRALMNPAQVDELGHDTFRFHLRGFEFLMLKIRPVVDLKIDVSQPGLLRVRAVDCWIKGNETINEQFSLELSGFLTLEDQDGFAQLNGEAKLAIAVGLPPVLQMTPMSLIEATGNQILRGILSTMKQRLNRQLAADYEQWSREQATDTQPQLALGNTAT